MIQPHPQSSPLPPGSRLERLEIVKLLHQGSHGFVYFAEDLELGRRVVVKQYGRGEGDASPAAEQALFRLVGEVLATVEHPALVRVHRCFEANDAAFMVMDPIEGEPLEALLRAVPDGHGPGEDTVRGWLTALLGALAALHRAGLVHRDIKSANVLIRADGTPVLIDFGAAEPADVSADRVLASRLTPGYAAPEQYLEGGEEGPWTDLYGLAALAYRVIAGRPPPDALTRLKGEAMVTAEVAGKGRYSPSLLAGIDRALALAAADRPRSAEEWLAALPEPSEPIAGGEAPLAAAGVADELPPTVRLRRVPIPVSASPVRPSPAAPERPPPEAGQAGRRRRWPWAAALALLIAAAPGGWYGWEYYLTHIKSEWIVDAAGGGDTRTITKALARAKVGATIKVRPGTYAETLVLDRQHRLIGDGKAEEIVIRGSGSAPCLTIAADGGSVRGLTLLGGKAGADPPVACVEVRAGAPIIADTIIGNEGGPGLLIGGDARPEVRNSRVRDTKGAGVVIEGRALARLSGNEIAGSEKAGLVIRGEAAPQVTGNRIHDTGQAGILVSGEGGGRIEDNQITAAGRSGIEVRGTANPVFVGNRVEKGAEAGLYVYGGGRGRFEGNVIAGNALSGVVIGPGGDPALTGNRIEGNGEHGVLVVDSGKGRLERNTITANKGYGIAIGEGAESERIDNQVSGNRAPQIAVGELSFPADAATTAADEDDGLGREAAPPPAPSGPPPGSRSVSPPSLRPPEDASKVKEYSL